MDSYRPTQLQRPKKFLKIFFRNPLTNPAECDIIINVKRTEASGETSYGLSVFPAKTTKKIKKIAENLLTNHISCDII